MFWQGKVELLLFFAMMIAVSIGCYELYFPQKPKREVPTKGDQNDDGTTGSD